MPKFHKKRKWHLFFTWKTYQTVITNARTDFSSCSCWVQLLAYNFKTTFLTFLQEMKISGSSPSQQHAVQYLNYLSHQEERWILFCTYKKSPRGHLFSYLRVWPKFNFSKFLLLICKREYTAFAMWKSTYTIASRLSTQHFELPSTITGCSERKILQ